MLATLFTSCFYEKTNYRTIIVVNTETMITSKAILKAITPISMYLGLIYLYISTFDSSTNKYIVTEKVMTIRESKNANILVFIPIFYLTLAQESHLRTTCTSYRITSLQSSHLTSLPTLPLVCLPIHTRIQSSCVNCTLPVHRHGLISPLPLTVPSRQILHSLGCADLG